MHKTDSRTQTSPDVARLDVGAPRLARVHQAGQFVIVRGGAAIADSNPVLGGWHGLLRMLRGCCVQKRVDVLRRDIPGKRMRRRENVSTTGRHFFQ